MAANFIFSENRPNKWTNPEGLRTINQRLATHNFHKAVELSKDPRTRGFELFGKIVTFRGFRLTGATKLATDG